MSRSAVPAFALLLLALLSITVVAGVGGAQVHTLSSDGVEVDMDTSELPPGTAADIQQTIDDEGNETAEYLTMPTDELDRAGIETGGIDVATAIGRDAGDHRAEFFREDLEGRLGNAETDEERRTVLVAAGDRLNDRIAVLQTRERNVLDPESADPTTDELFRTFATVDAESRGLLEVVRVLHEENAATSDSPLSDRDLATYRARLEPLYGPVRERIATATAEDDSIEVYLEVRDTDVSMTTLVDGDERFVREAHVRDARQENQPDRLGFSGAEDRFEELYPWVVENNAGFNIFVVGGAPYLHHADVYVVSAAHDHGFGSPEDLTTYIDGATTDVFYETQQLDPTLVTTRGTTERSDELELRLNWSRAGWPVAVEVIDLETDASVDASISFDGENVGSTGGDRLWTIGERGTITVEATHEGRSVATEMVLT